MTNAESRQRIDPMMKNAARKLAIMPVDQAADLVGRFFGEAWLRSLLKKHKE